MRKARKQTEFLWRGSSAYGQSSDIWTYSFASGAFTSRYFLPVCNGAFRYAILPQIRARPLQLSSMRWKMYLFVKEPFKCACIPIGPVFPAGTYYHPQGLALGELKEFGAQSEWVIDDDDDSTEPSNAKACVNALVTAASSVAGDVMGNDIAFTMGGSGPAHQISCIMPGQVSLSSAPSVLLREEQSVIR